MALPPGIGRTFGPPNNSTYKTASGEIIEDEGAVELQGIGENGSKMALHGRRSGVHKPLVAASQVQKKGHLTVLDGDGGCILPRASPLARKVRALLRTEVKKEVFAVPLYVEKGVYTGYIKLDSASPRSNKGKESMLLAPLAESSSSSSSSTLPSGSVSVPAASSALRGGSRQPMA